MNGREHNMQRDAEHDSIEYICADLEEVGANSEADRDGPRQHGPPAGELMTHALVTESLDPAARIEQNTKVEGDEQRDEPARPHRAEGEVHQLSEAEELDALGDGDLADGGESIARARAAQHFGWSGWSRFADWRRWVVVGEVTGRGCASGVCGEGMLGGVRCESAGGGNPEKWTALEPFGGAE
eukprot:scaffold518_cov33-Tisochrysis_lutea.AAC.3